jgi:hypothetical protein
VAITTSLTGNNETVVIDPVHRLEPGTRYELRLQLFAAGNLGTVDNTFVFFTAYDTTMPVQVTGFVLDEAVDWTADWNTTQMDFRWNTQPGVTGYRIYARDTEAKSDFVRVLTVAANQAVSAQTGTVNLGAAPFNTIFDVYAGDGIQTPFTAGRDVVFQIAAYNDAGQGAFSTAVTISDETPPTGSLGAPTGLSFNNNTGSPRTITIAFDASEYLAVGDTPSWQVIEQGGNAAYVLPNSAITFAWDADARGGVLTLVVPANTNASGDRLVLSSFSDSSGNVVDSDVSRLLNP